MPARHIGSYSFYFSSLIVEKLATLHAQSKDIWQTLPQIVTLAIYAIVKEPANPATGKLGRLSLTTVQRNEILKRLTDTFGASIQKELQEGQKSPEASAAALYKFLSNKKWKSQDSR
jgi:hypothetical protein